MATTWIALLVAAVIFVSWLGLYDYWAGGERQRDLISRTSLDDGEAGARRFMARLDVRIRRTRWGHKLENRITASGVPLTVGKFTLIALGAFLLAYLVASSTLAPFFGLPAGAAAVYACLAYLERKRQHRNEQFIAQLPELTRVLSNAASAGLAMRTAIEMAAEELDDPAAVEMRRVSEALRVGHSFETAMNALQERQPSRELAVLVTTLVLSSRAGGSLVTSLRNIADTLEARKDLRREIRTQLAQAMSTGYFVPIMGVGSLLLVNSIQPGALEAVTGSNTGRLALIAAGAMYVVGFILIRRMTKIET